MTTVRRSQSNWLSETHEGIVYLGLSVFLLLFAIVCFAIGSTSSGFVAAGITLLLLAVLCFLLFLWRRKKRGNGGRSGATSGSGGCLACILCLRLPTPEEREAEAQARLRDIIATSSSDSATVTPVAASGCRAARWPKLQALHKVNPASEREI
jgi:LPXTG-motif cell wall-anchored protein